jgi:type IV secretory pathway ATPase VirB11/archaellum biosynthesis ATPase
VCAGASVTLAQAVNSLLTRARPDVMVLGEITVHDEAREFLRAGNLGVRAMATIQCRRPPLGRQLG